MKQIVIKYHNGKDVKSITRELNSELDVQITFLEEEQVNILPILAA